MQQRKFLSIWVLILIVLIAGVSPVPARDAVHIKKSLCLTADHDLDGISSYEYTLSLTNFGNKIFSISGTESWTLVTNPPTTVTRVVSGSGAVIAGVLEISLKATEIPYIAATHVVEGLEETHIRMHLNPGNLNGTYERVTLSYLDLADPGATLTTNAVTGAVESMKCR